ncbi:DJ-1/PfpI family protein [Colletotrichum sublineola]|uniref:Putative DJ-1/PfpI family protein n=1 Tax=Colletotrichum sublineola TaxID=1173701 RepID=A0A066X239_COLSU|nr:DJ-1/PfpI family protein [Colletotrichum sublineola]KDN63042.1 putative DJ-1/PfpI family protein [Colletotrichum sublineola]
MHLALPTPHRWWSTLLGLLWACLAVTAAAQNEVETSTTVPQSKLTATAASTGPGTTLPKNFGVIVYHAYEMLDIFGPLSALGQLARMRQMNLYMISETMDPVTVEPASPAMNTKNSSFFPVLLPTHTYATAPKDLEVLIVPGGLWTRSPNLNSTIAYIRAVYPSLRYLVSVCTGAGVVARAGVLDGRRATTNKAAWASTIVHGPRTEWVARARWVVDGNVWTSSGVSAGIDATLGFIEEVYGAANATYIADMMEYDWHRDPSWDPYADKFNVTGA